VPPRSNAHCQGETKLRASGTRPCAPPLKAARSVVRRDMLGAFRNEKSSPSLLGEGDHAKHGGGEINACSKI
jgi:hypothetical protein